MHLYWTSRLHTVTLMNMINRMTKSETKYIQAKRNDLRGNIISKWITITLKAGFIAPKLLNDPLTAGDCFSRQDFPILIKISQISWS